MLMPLVVAVNDDPGAVDFVAKILQQGLGYLQTS